MILAGLAVVLALQAPAAADTEATAQPTDTESRAVHLCRMEAARSEVQAQLLVWPQLIVRSQSYQSNLDI